MDNKILDKVADISVKSVKGTIEPLIDIFEKEDLKPGERGTLIHSLISNYATAIIGTFCPPGKEQDAVDGHLIYTKKHMVRMIKEMREDD